MQRYVDVEAEQRQPGDFDAAEPEEREEVGLQKFLKLVPQS